MFVLLLTGGQGVHDAHGPGLGGVRAAGAVPGGVRRGGRAAQPPRRRGQRLRVRAPHAAPRQRAPRQARQPHHGHHAAPLPRLHPADGQAVRREARRPGGAAAAPQRRPREDRRDRGASGGDAEESRCQVAGNKYYRKYKKTIYIEVLKLITFGVVTGTSS